MGLPRRCSPALLVQKYLLTGTKVQILTPARITGPTDLISSAEMALVDELYIEMHFHFPALGWHHDLHSMHQAFDILRQLRDCGVAVHAWA